MEWISHDITLWILLALMLSAFAAGFIDSVAGGGGLILVPSFILAGLPPQVALGQEKIVSTLGTTAAIRNFVRNQKVVWAAVTTGIPAGLLGAYLGAEAILYFDPDTISWQCFLLGSSYPSCLRKQKSLIKVTLILKSYYWVCLLPS
jgi:uncharacterized membrane protein YfcA